MHVSYQIIDTRSGLEAAVRSLDGERCIAFDLEADSMYHFQEKVCLLQMATRTLNVVIDPLEVKDLSSLRPVFKSSSIQKIFHGADYDVRSLYRDFGIEINNLFDTELASRFVGIRETGLEAVLQARFDIRLDKKFQKKDWSRRPLPREMIEYAASDSVHLIPLARALQTELTDKGRLDWVTEECDILSRVRPPDPDSGPMFLRVRGAGKLSPRSLAALEAMLEYRQDVAKKKDRPLFKVFSNRSLLKIAARMPRNLKQLVELNVWSPKQVNMYGTCCIACIHQALKMSVNELPVYPRTRAPRVSARVPQRIEALKRWRESQAEQLDLDPALICNNALIGEIASKHPKSKSDLLSIEPMKNWQRREFGQNILDVLKTVN